MASKETKSDSDETTLLLGQIYHELEKMGEELGGEIRELEEELEEKINNIEQTYAGAIPSNFYEPSEYNIVFPDYHITLKERLEELSPKGREVLEKLIELYKKKDKGISALELINYANLNLNPHNEEWYSEKLSRLCEVGILEKEEKDGETIYLPKAEIKEDTKGNFRVDIEAYSGGLLRKVIEVYKNVNRGVSVSELVGYTNPKERLSKLCEIGILEKEEKDGETIYLPKAEAEIGISEGEAFGELIELYKKKGKGISARELVSSKEKWKTASVLSYLYMAGFLERKEENEGAIYWPCEEALSILVS